MSENQHSKTLIAEAVGDREGGAWKNQSPSHRQLMQHDSVFGYKYLPGLKMRVAHEGGGYLIKTNQEGFRCNNEVTAQKQKHKRVLVFGDSYTAGDGVSNGKRYSDVLEQNLHDTEVLNFGLSGSGTDQQFLISQQYANKTEHDAIVIGVLLENIQRIMVKSREWSDRDGQPLLVPKPWYELSAQGDLTLKGVPVPLPHKVTGENESGHAVGRFALLRKLINKLGPDFKDMVQKLTRYQPLPDFDSADSPGWKLMQSILGKWIAESNVPVIVVVIPVYQYVEKTASYTNIRKRFDEFSKSTGASVYHVIDELWSYPAKVRRTFRFQNDCHLTPLAHKVIGEALAKVLAPVLEKN
ncbi:MAG: SGNH/GDSL hydrolase family protein [Burkholderiaceae bacterium]